MNTCRIKSVLILISIITLIGSKAYSAEQNYENVQIRTEKVADNLFVLFGAGGNIGVFADKDSVFMIDTSYAPLSAKIRATIGSISDKPIRFILITQWHRDHVGGNEYFARSGATLVAHEKVRKRLGEEQYMDFFKAKIPPLPESARPVITFSKDVTFHMQGNDILAFNAGNAHTDGDSIVYFRGSNVIHMGDIFFSGMYPFIDLSAGGTINGVIEAVRHTLALCNSGTKIIPGHGPVTDKAGLEAYLDMLVKVRDRIAKAVKEGKSLETVIAERPTADCDQQWGKGFLKSEQFVQIVYTSLRKDQESCGKKP